MSPKKTKDKLIESKEKIINLIENLPKVRVQALQNQENELIRFYNNRITDFYRDFEEEFTKKTKE